MKFYFSIIFLLLAIILTAQKTYALEEIDYQDLFDNHQSMMLIIHPTSGVIHYANQASADFYGYPVEALIGMNINLINTLTPEEVLAERLNALTEERNFFVFKHRIASGMIKTVHVYSYPVEINEEMYLFSIIIDQTEFSIFQTRNKNLTIVLVVFLSLTVVTTVTIALKIRSKKKEFEQLNLEIDEQKITLATLISNLPGVAYRRKNNKDFTFIYASDQIAELTGYTSEEFYSNKITYAQLIHPEDYNTIYLANQTKKNLEKKLDVTYRIIDKNNQIKWVHVSYLHTNQKTEDGFDIIEGFVQDVTDTVQKTKDIIHMSKHDVLTSLPNRRYFEEQLALLDCADNFPLLVAMIDLDGLKLTNDAYGHDVGDEVLKKIAFELKRNTRETDFVSRIGGDEFVILCPKTTSDEFESILKSIRGSVTTIGVDGASISLSIGHAIKFDDSVRINNVIKEAENKMYGNKILHGQSSRNEAILSLFETFKGKYNDEKTHSDRVSQFCKKMGKVLNLGEDSIFELELAGLMHDIGKITIPDHILDKPGKLNDEEWVIMKKHTIDGYHILRSADKYSRLAEYALTHHERWDGNGYPNGIKGEAIPLFSRIINIADSYEAMTSDRPYRKALSHSDAIAELYRCSGSQFDEELVKIFVTNVLEIN